MRFLWIGLYVLLQNDHVWSASAALAWACHVTARAVHAVSVLFQLALPGLVPSGGGGVASSTHYWRVRLGLLASTGDIRNGDHQFTTAVNPVGGAGGLPAGGGGVPETP